MSPTCSKAAMRALISIILATSVANAAALPHEVLDARDAAPIQNAQLAAEAIQAAANAAAENSTNFFEVVSDELNNRTAWQVFSDFFSRLFGPRDDDNASATVTITVTPTPTDTTSTVSSAINIVIPSPSDIPTLVVVSELPSTTPAPTSESEIIFSILPVGDLSSAINATFLTPVFVTESATPSATEIVAPFPIDNATDSYGPLPTAASITGMFSVNIPLVTDIPTPANSSLPEGTGIALPSETIIPVVNVTLPLVNITEPLADNATSISVVIVTETVTPVPIIGTGTSPAISAGTGLPIIIVGSPLWPNASYGEPTAILLPTGTAPPLGTGLPLGTGISIPLGTGATAVLPIETAISYGTGIPLMTGTGGLPVGTDLPLAASPLFPNTTSSSEPSIVILPVPILVTGVPEPVLINVTIPSVNISSAADTLEGSVTEVPITVTGAPGSIIAISVTIPSASHNATAAIETAVAPVETTEAPVSVGTGLPIASLAADLSAPFANTTAATETATATAILILPVETPDIDAGQLNVTISLPTTAGYSR